MRALAIVVMTMTSCAVPSIVDCGDDRFCPAGSVCTVSGCSLPGVCGDGAIDDGELCDDGNRISADGCSATCVVEGCPNGDLDQGEECDDGNGLSHDGCSSGCLVERPTWHELLEVSPPGAIGDMTAAWLPDRGRAILHGGKGGSTNLGDAWWWDGITWTRAPSGPPPLSGHAMAWDGADTVVMFGGGTVQAPSDACWLFSTSWSPCAGPLPPARSFPAIASGATAGEVVLQGGSGAGDLRSTWKRDAAGWSDIGRSGPISNGLAAMAYDPRAREHVLVFLHTAPAKTWTLGAAGAAGWTDVLDGLEPRNRTVMVHDPDRNTMVFAGGQDEFVGVRNETYERASPGWAEVSVGARPPPRHGHVSFHDSIRRGIIVFGGYGPAAVHADTWILRWESATVDEDCSVTTDADDDGLEGCADPDCWGRCDPRCAAHRSDCDPDRPRCGDTRCNLDLETASLCPGDCS